MHASQREAAILDAIAKTGFVAFRELEKQIEASPATLRRDLERMAAQGRINRVRGGASTTEPQKVSAPGAALLGVPFHENIGLHSREKAAIGKAAADLCTVGEGVMIDGGSTTLQMCPHLAGLDLQVLTNSIHIVSALLPQAGTRILVPGGAVFREQNIILSAASDDLMPRFHAPKLFMGAAAISAQGVMQADIVLVAVEQRLIDRAEQVILLVDSSKFESTSGNVVCELDQLDVVVTDDRIKDQHRSMLDAAGVALIVVPVR